MDAIGVQGNRMLFVIQVHWFGLQYSEEEKSISHNLGYSDKISKNIKWQHPHFSLQDYLQSEKKL